MDLASIRDLDRQHQWAEAAMQILLAIAAVAFGMTIFSVCAFSFAIPHDTVRVMSALGQKQTCAAHTADVRFVPIADIAAYSMTSSARASMTAGVRPSALAVLRLITSSYLVGACTGRSAGFSPLRMRST